MTVAILCGHHTVANRFTRHMMECYTQHVAFVEMEGHSNLLAQVSGREGVQLTQYESEEKTIELIKSHGVTTVVLAWWPKIVHRINKLGINVINTHPSFLPYNRGKHPYYWAIVDGTPFGVTIHRVDNGVDTGDILWQVKIPLLYSDTGESAYNKASDAMTDLLYAVAEDIALERFPEGIKQDETIATAHKAKQFVQPLIELPIEIVNDLRARTFDNSRSGRKIAIDGKLYNIHFKLVEEQ